MPLSHLDMLWLQGREYQALVHAEMSLQHQTRALLKRLHGGQRDQGAPELLNMDVSSLPCASVSSEAGMDDHSRVDIQYHPVTMPATRVSQNGDQPSAVTHPPHVPAWLRLTPRHWPRGRWQPEAYLLHSDAAQTLVVHAQALHTARSAQATTMTHTMHRLPIWEEWCAAIRGVGELNLALILCETGDLWYYPTVAKVWKRMGVGLWQGEIQRRKAGVSQQDVLAMGFVPERRAIIYNLQKGLLLQNKACEGHAHQACQDHPGAYRQLYLARKALEQEKDSENTKAAWHNRASRYMGKCFLRDLWSTWRQVMPRPVAILSALAPSY